MKAALVSLTISGGGLVVSLLVIFLMQNSLSQETSLSSLSPEPEQEAIIAKSIDFHTTVLITGSIVKNDNMLLSNLGALKAIVEKQEVAERGCSYSPDTEDATLLKNIDNVTSFTLRTLVPMQLIVQEIPADHTKIGTFDLYLVMHDQGNIKHSIIKGSFFDSQVSQSAGSVQVYHAPPYRPATIEESGAMFCCLMQAMEPLCTQLEGTCLWIRAIETDPASKQLVETTGIVWGGKDPTINTIYDTPLIPAPAN